MASMRVASVQAIYAHSAEGLKIRMMRANPNVRFQVDQRENLANWRSVWSWGVYEELHGKEAGDALQLLWPAYCRW